jgi:hypothetical protein
MIQSQALFEFCCLCFNRIETEQCACVSVDHGLYHVSIVHSISLCIEEPKLIGCDRWLDSAAHEAASLVAVRRDDVGSFR